MKKVVIGVVLVVTHALSVVLGGMMGAWLYPHLSKYVDNCCRGHSDIISMFIGERGRTPVDGRELQLWRGLFYALKGCPFKAGEFEAEAKAYDAKFEFVPCTLDQITNSFCRVVKVKSLPANLFFDMTERLNTVVRRDSGRWASHKFDMIETSAREKVWITIPYLRMLLAYPHTEEDVKAKIRAALRTITGTDS